MSVKNDLDLVFTQIFEVDKVTEFFFLSESGYYLNSNINNALIQIFRINRQENFNPDGTKNFIFRKVNTFFSKFMVPFYNINTYVRNSKEPKRITIIDFNSMINVDLETGTFISTFNCDNFLNPFQSRSKIEANRVYYDN